jgi:hypothetical protein
MSSVPAVLDGNKTVSLAVGWTKVKVEVYVPADDSKLKAAGTAVKVSLGLISPSQLGLPPVPPMLIARYSGCPQVMVDGKAV